MKASLKLGLIIMFAVLLAGCTAGKKPNDSQPMNGYLTNADGYTVSFTGWTELTNFTWQGDSKPGLVTGRGILEIRAQKDGRILQHYEGQMKNGVYHGKGRLVSFFSDGTKEIYNGQWVEDAKTGQGHLIIGNGDEYRGGFKKNLFDGQGTYIWKSTGNKYVGQWRDHKRNGQGTYYNPGGLDCNPFSRYVGGFKDDLLHGFGIQYDAAGKVIRRGYWQNGCPYDGTKAQWLELNRADNSANCLP